MSHTIAIFGETEKGDYQAAYSCKKVEHLAQYLGEPGSQNAKGLSLAIQTLLFDCPVLFFRVSDEGFSISEYLKGLAYLEKYGKAEQISAIGLPGVGNSEIIKAAMQVCRKNNSYLITTDSDLYDFLTFRQE